MTPNSIYSLTEEARKFFAPSHAPEFFRVIDSRVGVRVIRAVAVLAGSIEWLDNLTFEVDPDELEAVALPV